MGHPEQPPVNWVSSRPSCLRGDGAPVNQATTSTCGLGMGCVQVERTTLPDRRRQAEDPAHSYHDAADACYSAGACNSPGPSLPCQGPRGRGQLGGEGGVGPGPHPTSHIPHPTVRPTSHSEGAMGEGPQV